MLQPRTIKESSRKQLGPWKLALKVFLGSTENRFLIFFHVRRGDDLHALIGALLCPDCPMSAAVAGVAESWQDARDWTICVQGDSSMILQFLPALQRLSMTILFRQNFLWTSNSPRVVLHCYWMWFSKTTLLRVCVAVRQPSPWLHRERMEPSWRIRKHTHKPLHISSLLYDLMGSVTLEIFDIGATSPQGHWFTGDQCLKSLLLKSHHQTKDIKATVGTDCMFSQSDLSDEGSHLWLSLLYAGGDLPSCFFPCLVWCLAHRWLSVPNGEHFNPWC